MLTVYILTALTTWLAASLPAALVCGRVIALRDAHEGAPRGWAA